MEEENLGRKDEFNVVQLQLYTFQYFSAARTVTVLPSLFWQILSASPLQYFSDYFSNFLEYPSFLPKALYKNL